MTQPVNLAPPHNLPLPLQPLFGRERELAEARARIHASKKGIITLVGVGGVGKTRLALAIAQEAMPDFRHGVWFASLASLQDPSYLPHTIANALGLREPAEGSVEAQLIHYLSSRRVLLVLDNCEHLRDSCATLVAQLLAKCADLVVLATSRAPLRVSDEHRLTISPLGLPGEGADSVLTVTRASAVAMFVARVRTVEPAFEVTAENAAAVGAICRRLDGLPLAIELAAVRLKARTPDELLVELGERLRALSGGSRTREARQRTIHALLDWSYTLLGPGEQALFARLSVFSGGWTLQSATAICVLDDDLPFAMEAGMVALIDQSLIQGVSEGSRFGMLETVREYATYALTRLSAPDELERVHSEHAHHFLAIAQEADSGLHGLDQVIWTQRVERDHENIRAALMWANSAGNPRLALLLAGAAGSAWLRIGHWVEADATLAQALALTGTGDQTQLLARCNLLRGKLHHFRGQYDTATRLLEAALTGFLAIGDRLGVAQATGFIGEIAIVHREFARALGCFELEYSTASELSDSRGFAVATGHIGAHMVMQGNFASAREWLQRQLDLSTTLGDQVEMVHALVNLGAANHFLGDYSQALDQYCDALEISWVLGEIHTVMIAAFNIGELYQLHGEYTSAMASFRFALKTALRLEDRDNTLCASWKIALNLLETEEPDRGFLEYALTLARALDSPSDLVDVLSICALRALAEGNNLTARAALVELIRTANKVGRADMQVKPQLQLVELRLTIAEIDRESAVRECQPMLAAEPDESDAAAIYDALWRFSGDPDFLNEAISRYRKLYDRTPHIEYRTRLLKLTGLPVSTPAPLPPLPEQLAQPTESLDQLLAGVGAMVSRIEADQESGES